MPTALECKRRGKVKNKVTGRCRRKCRPGKEMVDSDSGFCVARKKRSRSRSRSRSRNTVTSCKKKGKLLNKVTGGCRRKCKSGKERIDPDSGRCVRKGKKGGRRRRRRRDEEDDDVVSDEDIEELEEQDDEDDDSVYESEEEEEDDDDGGDDVFSPLIVRRRVRQRKKKAKTAQKQFLKKYGKNAVRLLPRGFVVSKKIGEGSYGSIWKICDEDGFADCNYVVKVEKIVRRKKPKKELVQEFKVQKEFYRKKLTIEPIEQSFFKKGQTTYSLILMRRVDGTLESWLEEQRTDREIQDVFEEIIALNNKIKRAKFTHGDFNVGNIGFDIEIVRRGREEQFRPVFFPIDFGWATTKTNVKNLDLLQLYRVASSFSKPGKKEYNRNRRKLAALIKPILLRAGFSASDLSARNIDSTFEDEHDEYERRYF